MKHTTKFISVLVIGVVALILEFVFQLNLAAQIIVTIMGSLIALSMLIEMIKTLRSGKYGVDLLAITAIVATLAVSEYWAGLMILVMLTGGDSLEDYASKKANSELKTLLDNSPQTAHKLINNELQDIGVDEALVGDQLVVKPGEGVATDGHIISGESSFDESQLTGEARPVNKKPGDRLMSGSINGDGSITMIVDKVAAESQYQQIIKLVKESEAKPAHFVRMADRYAVPFTLVSYLIAGIAWIVSGDPVRFAEVLVVASPCPLILAAPIALVSGMSRSSRNGIIVKTGTTIEKLSKAKSIAFDKTGTITEGILTVEEIKPEPHFTADDLLHLTASAEQQSSHILARSLVEYVGPSKLSPTESLEEVTGNGVQAKVDGKCIKVGKPEFATSNVKLPDIGKTAVYISVNDVYAGYITFSDRLRPEAKETIDELKQFGMNKVIMLTGDQQETAEVIAQKVGITDVHAECLPADKIHVLESVDKQNRPIIMVGDGVNDAPALAIADIGIAMGARGSSAASESADAVIVKDDLHKVSTAIKISRRTMEIARQSVLIGIFICVFLMLVASTGLVPALFGAMLQEVVDTVSILWALKARKD